MELKKKLLFEQNEDNFFEKMFKKQKTTILTT